MEYQDIHPTVKLGQNVRIWSFVYIGHDTRIGKNTKIGSLVHIDYDVVIGENCKIEGLAYISSMSRIGNYVFIGPSVTTTNDPYPTVNRMYGKNRLSGVIIRDGAIIGANSVIKPGVVIGLDAVVGAGSVVTKDVERETVVFGNPAKVKGKRDDFNKKQFRWDAQ